MSSKAATTWPRRIIRGIATVSVCSVFLSGAYFASSAEAAPPDGAADPVVALPKGTGPSGDTKAIARAASNYSEDDPSSIADLVETASAEDAVALNVTGASKSASTRNGRVSIDSVGGVSLTSIEGVGAGISMVGSADSVQSVDGAIVQTGVAPSTDVVTRATEDGVQLVAVLADETASNELEFAMELPEGAELVRYEDGSVGVVAEIEVERALPGEEVRVTAAVNAILGRQAKARDSGELKLSEKQWAALEAIPPARTAAVSERVLVATLSAPWAVDANGDQLATHYVVDRDSLVQVIDIQEETVFPVVADPSWAWYLRKSAECLASVGFLIASPGAKIASVAAKVVSLLKKAKAGSSLKRAYDAWLRLGSYDGERLVNFLSSMRIAVSILRDYGVAQLPAKMLARGGRVAASYRLILYGGTTVASVFGVGSCFSLITGRDY